MFPGFGEIGGLLPHGAVGYGSGVVVKEVALYGGSVEFDAEAGVCC